MTDNKIMIRTTTDNSGSQDLNPEWTEFPDRDSYEKELKKRQEEHLKQIKQIGQQIPWHPCMHDGCLECIGTGRRRDGSACIHNLSCPCPKCSPWC